MFKRILVCSDGSDAALHAAKVAAKIAGRCRADVTLLSVFYPAALMTPFANAPEAAPSMEVVMEWGEEMHTSIQEKTGAVLREAGVSYQPCRELGPPVDVIINAAQNQKADLIVLGSRGMTEWKALLMGSVSDGVLHRAPCAVLIVRGEETTLDRILLASDSSAGSYQATLVAGMMARKFETPLTIINVLEQIGSSNRFVQSKGRLEGNVLRVHELTAQRIRRVVDQAGVDYNLYQEVGHPAETVVRYAKENHYSLIVVGSRGMNALTALALGSVSNRIAHHAHCSVLVVR